MGGSWRRANPALPWRLVWLALGLIVLSALGAVVAVAVAEPAPSATIRGHIELCGGPAPGHCWVSGLGASYGSSSWEADRVAALLEPARGRTPIQTRVRRGRFSLKLPPGRYELQLLGDGRRTHGKVLERRRASVRANRTATVTFLFSVP